MKESFVNSMIPEFLATPFVYTLPILEFVVGILLIVVLFTRQALILTAAIMIALVFGSTMVENREIIDSQLIHALLFISRPISAICNRYFV